MLKRDNFHLWFEIIKVSRMAVPSRELLPAVLSLVIDIRSLYLMFFMQTNDTASKVQTYLTEYIELAGVKDDNGETALSVASSSNKCIIRSFLHFCGRYDIQKGPPVHRSATSIVVLAHDYVTTDYEKVFIDQREDIKSSILRLGTLGYDTTVDLLPMSEYLERMNKSKLTVEEFVTYCENNFGKSRKVAIKFMLNCDHYQKEKEYRNACDLDEKFVLNLLEGPDDASIETALASLVIDFGYEKIRMKSYKYAIIMPAADRSLEAIYTSEQPDSVRVRTMMKEIAEALHNCHVNEVIHCDLKMLNVVRVNGHMKLIDFDAACKRGSSACSKFSSGVLPPEMFHKLANAEEERKLEVYWSSFPSDAAMTELRKKVNPKKSKSGAFCVKAYYGGDGAAPENLPYKLVAATPQLDIWSFGIMLYTLSACEVPFNVSRDGDLVGANDMKTVVTMNRESNQLLILRKFESDPVLADLLLKLLEPDSTKRLQSMVEVLLHPYFLHPQERGDGNLMIKEMNDRTKRMEQVGKETLMSIEKVTVNVERFAFATLAQIQKTEQVLLRGMFEAADVIVPSSFVIVNQKLQPDTPDLKLITDGETERKSSLRFVKKLSVIGSALSVLVAVGEGKVTVNVALKEFLTNETFYLYLVDEQTMKPVVPTEKGIYPIQITTPAVFIPKVLPLMKVAMKAAQLLNGAAGIARLLGYPVPLIDKAFMDMASKAVGDLHNKSSVEEFDMLQKCLDSDSTGAAESAERRTESVRGAPLRELARFLLEYDPDCTFSGLRRVSTPLGDCCWTTDAGVAALRDGGRLELEPWDKVKKEEPPDAQHKEEVTVEVKRQKPVPVRPPSRCVIM